MIIEKTTQITDRRRYLEIGAVVLTAVGKFLFMDLLNWRFPFVAVAVLGWTLYVIYRKKQQPTVSNYWGFRKDTFRRVLRLMLPFGFVSIVSFFFIGVYQDSINITWHILPILVSYPIWGTIQQFLIIALVAGNLHDMKSIRASKFFIILMTAILFSLVHFPSYWLMLGTFLLALFYGYVYLKAKNLYALGLFHGWLGAMFYYTVVGSDPFADVFLKLFS
ncbi:MAG: CPBP family glutamic-type intramembrane protease [Bacteroidota bacterium]